MLNLLDWAGRADPPGEKLSEEHLVSAAVTYAHGELPIVQRMFDLQRPPSALSLNPLNIISHAYVSVLSAIGAHRTLIGRPLVSTTLQVKNHYMISVLNLFPSMLFYVLFFLQCQVLLALIVYNLIESIDWSAVVPIAVYHGSFMAMIIFTCQVRIFWLTL